MIVANKIQSTGNVYTCRRILPGRETPGIKDDISSGFLSKPRSIPPKYFYDAVGSDLFDQICDTKDYYPTRTEAALLQTYADNIIQLSKPDNIVELGSGTSRKTRYLLDACQQTDLQPIYWPFDVCEPLLIDVAKDLTRDYCWLDVNALVGDYHAGFNNFPAIEGRNLYVFIGGTVGNFTNAEAIAVLSELRSVMSQDDILLLGADRVKDIDILQRAYNDSEGVTAKFNLNVLEVLNRELQADFAVDDFYHEAIYDESSQQIEMYVASPKAQTVNIGALNQTVSLAKDEKILTEISRKFTSESLQLLLNESGFVISEHFEPDNAFFSLVLASPA